LLQQLLHDLEAEFAAGKEEIRRGTDTVLQSLEIAMSVADELQKLAKGPVAQYLADRESAGYGLSDKNSYDQLRGLLRRAHIGVRPPRAHFE